MYQTILRVIIPSVTLFATAANTMLLMVLFKFGHLLQPANKMLRQFLAIQDIALCSTYCAVNLAVLYLDQDIPSLLCDSLSIVAVMIFRCQWSSISIIAIERYIYVVHPLKYPRLMTKCKTLVGIGVCIAITVIFTIVTEVFFDRKLDVILLACIYNNTVSSNIHIFVFAIPSFIITITISVVLWKVTKKIHAEDPAITKPQIRKSFKLISFISGTFWITYIPFMTAFLVSEVLSKNLGFFNEALLSPFKSSCVFIIIYGSPSINPVLQFYLHTDLWIGLQRLFGKKLLFSYQREIKEAMNI